MPKYYNFDKVMSFDGVYNFIVGGRGIGKTYGAIKAAIKRCIKHDEEFIYLRRYKDELATARQNFFTEMVHEFPDFEFRIAGNKGDYRPIVHEGEPKPEWKRLVHFVPLSTTQANKSVAYPKVTRIIFDEFIIEKGAVHYIRDETRVFNNFFSTVDRWKDKTKVQFLANSVSITNPYFVDFKIDPDAGEFVVKEKGFVVVHFVDSTDFMNEVSKTRFGQFIEGTEYAEFAMSNKFADNDARLIQPKTSEAMYVYSLRLSDRDVSIWGDYEAGVYYVQEAQPARPYMFTIYPEKVSDDCGLLIRSDKMLSKVRTSFRYARLRFDSPQTRNSLTEVFKY